MGSVVSWPVVARPNTLKEKLQQSLAEDPGTSDLIGADLADMAEVMDCVGVFDSDRPAKLQPGSGDTDHVSDKHARLRVEGITFPNEGH